MISNLHIVFHDVADDVEKVGSEVVKALTTAGKVVDKIIYTDDNGQRELNPLITDAADVVEAVDPALAPVINKVETVATTAGGDVASIADTVTTDAAAVEAAATGTTTTDPTTGATTSTGGSDVAAAETAASDAPGLVKEIETDVEKLVHDL